VLLVPARIPPHKPAGEDPGAEHRLRMCELLIEGAEGLSIGVQELERDGPSYSVDTLKAIHASYPGAQLTFIVGADTASTLPSWREPVRILELADLAVAGRSGSVRRGVLDTLAGLGAAAPADRPLDARVSFLDMPEVEISSSMARARAARGEPIADIVGPAVAEYIAGHGLYRAPAGVAG